jgi:hypothetical protein
MNAPKKKIDPVTWIGIFVFAVVAIMIAMLLYEAISGRDEYEAEQRADAASAVTAASAPAGSGTTGAAGTAASVAVPASGGQ